MVFWEKVVTVSTQQGLVTWAEQIAKFRAIPYN